MRNLALSAASALDQAGLREVLEALRGRVFDRPTDELCETERAADGRWLFHYKPMVELLLREIIDITRTRDLTAHERRRRIAWALDIAGF